MYRSKDFQYMKVVDVKGNNLGYIKDVLIDFHNNKVKGFIVSSINLFKKSQQVIIEDIIAINKIMIVNSFSSTHGFPFSNIKDFEVYNNKGILLGVLEDLIIDNDNFKIRGVVISSGIIHKLINGKSILIPNKCILGDDYLLYYDDDSRIKLYSMPHKNNGGNG